MSEESNTTNTIFNTNTEMTIININSKDNPENNNSTDKSEFEKIIIKAYKLKNSKRIFDKLHIALDEIDKIVKNANDESQVANNLINKNIIDKLSRIIERRYFNVNILIAKIFENLLDVKNFKLLTQEAELLVNFANEVLNLLESIKSTIVSRQLEKKCSHLLYYLNNLPELNDEQKSTIGELILSFPDRDSSKAYKDFSNLIQRLQVNITNKTVNEKIEALNQIMESYGNTANLEEQFDLLLEMLPPFINAMLANQKIEDKEVYFHLGNFLCSMLYSTKFKVDAHVPNYDIDYEDLNKNSFLLFNSDELLDSSTKTSVSFLHSSVYELTTQKEILSKCERFFKLIISPYIHTLLPFNSVFDLQFVNYLLLKRVYFTFPQFRKEIEDSLITTLTNICAFQDNFEKENSEECRVYVHYLLKYAEEDLRSKLEKSIEEKTVNIDLQSELSDSELKDTEYEYLRISDFNLRIGYPNCQQIDAGAQLSRYVEVHHPNSLVYFGFATQENDITLHVLKYVPDDEGKNFENTLGSFSPNDDETIDEEAIDEDYSDKGHFKKLLKLEKVDCSANPVKIVLFVPLPGTYKIIFDNSYSWFTSKLLRYRLSVLKPFSEIDLERKVDFSKLRSKLGNKNNQSDSPHKNKILMVKFEGQNKAYKVGKIFSELKIIDKNPQYMTIPVLLTSNSIRIFDKKGVIESKVESGINNTPFNIQFEEECMKYFQSIGDFENKNILLNLFIMDKKLNIVNTVSESEYNFDQSDTYVNNVIQKIGFYPFKLLENFPNVRMFCCSLADSCLLYLLYSKVVKEEKFDNIIHIHFDQYKSQAALYFEGVIHEKFSGYNYNENENLVDNMKNVLEFIKKINDIFGSFDLSVSCSDIDIKLFDSFVEELKSNLDNLAPENKITIEKRDESFFKNAINSTQLFYMND